ncbi:MAG: AcrB/AcrD/AcrF family protein [Desulfuromonas sp.]|nr:MAG: AcrB/AcrD/AcrF family protein [Desulfuromonas sp.]
MKGPIRWMTENHVAANLLMAVLIIGGIMKAPDITQEVFPEVDLDRVQVSVAYPGAGPEEVEEGILLKIEESLTGLDGVKQLKASANEGIGVVTAEVYQESDVDDVLQDIRSEVDRITTFPEDAEQPVVSKMLRRREVISLVVYGDVPERTLREQAETLKDELLALPNITQVDLSGVRPLEIAVEISQENLRRYGLTLEQVAQRIRAASLDLPGGTIRTEGEQILVRTKERRYWANEYAELVMLATADGTSVKLGDIATVRETFEETDEAGRYNGQPAAMLKIYRIGDQKPIEIAETVIDFAETRQKDLPQTIRLASWNDSSEIFASRMNLLQKNAFLGLILVIIVLGLFLELRLALWVMLGIPISFFGTLFVMPWIGVSINMVSLFAFILALGIVVDDAIVVGENIFELRQKRDKTFIEAAIEGAREVSVPVTFAILTTVAAFMPLVFVAGMMGKFIKVIPAIVISLLVVSLIECLFVLPSHLAHSKKRSKEPQGLLGLIERNRKRFGHGLERFVHGPYRRILELNLRYRYASLAIGIAAMILTIGLVRGGIVKFTFMPDVEGDRIVATVQMNRGTPIEETTAVVRRIEQAALDTVAEFDAQLEDGRSVLRGIYSLDGATAATGGPAGGAGSSASYLGSVAVLLTRSENRDISTADIRRVWEEKVGQFPGVRSLSFASNLVRLGANIDVQLAHDDFAVLEKASDRLREALSEYPGVSDIEDTYAKGKRELKLKLSDAGRSLALTEFDLARQVRSAYYGAEALRLQRGRNEVKVIVRYPQEDRAFLASLENMLIRTPDGGEIPLLRAADVSEGRGFSSINRTDRKRVINVSARVDSKVNNAQEILDELRSELLTALTHDYPGLEYSLEGEESERRDSIQSMKAGFKIALVMIFVLLAIPFRSYSQPLLIMSAIPFGMVGAVLGHLIMGYNLSLLSLFGLVALAGVVVNDSLLLIDRANSNRRYGLDSHDSLVEAGTRRFRPILLTSLTTFFGLSPMIVETSVQAKFLIPMAISLGFGILFATGITLLLIPALYLILEDIRSLFKFSNKHFEADKADYTFGGEEG